MSSTILYLCLEGSVLTLALPMGFRVIAVPTNFSGQFSTVSHAQLYVCAKYSGTTKHGFLKLGYNLQLK